MGCHSTDQVLPFWLMSWGFASVFLDNSSLSSCHLSAKLSHNMMLPLPCFTAEFLPKVFFKFYRINLLPPYTTLIIIGLLFVIIIYLIIWPESTALIWWSSPTNFSLAFYATLVVGSAHLCSNLSGHSDEGISWWWIFIVWYLMLLTPPSVPFLLFWGSFEPFRTKLVHFWHLEGKIYDIMSMWFIVVYRCLYWCLWYLQLLLRWKATRHHLLR